MWHRAAPLVATVVGAVIVLAATTSAAAADVTVTPGVVLAQTSPGDDGAGGSGPRVDTSGAPEADLTPTGSGANVENVTTTESKLRWVVLGLVAIAAVSALLTLGFAHHTSPRRRERVERAREQARAERLRAAAALAGLGAEGRRVAPPVGPIEPPPGAGDGAAPPVRRVQPPVAAASPVATAPPPRARPVAAPDAANGAPAREPRRRDPRPRPRRR